MKNKIVELIAANIEGLTAAEIANQSLVILHFHASVWQRPCAKPHK